MKKLWVLGLVGLAALGVTASAQSPSPGALVNRLSLTYRTLQSYRSTAAWTRKVGNKEMTATITLAAQRPNKYLLDVKGDKVNTLVVSDGNTLIAYRPDRKVYTKTKAPVRLLGANILSGIDLPTPGARVITFLLQGGTTITDRPEEMKLTGPQGFGDKLAYVLTFRFDEDHDARIYVTSDDYLVRRVALLKEGSIEIDEKIGDIELNKPVAPETFAWAPPEDARMVGVLPPLENPTAVAGGGKPAPDFTLHTVDGGSVSLSKLKGKIVLLNFYFVH